MNQPISHISSVLQQGSYSLVVAKQGGQVQRGVGGYTNTETKEEEEEEEKDPLVKELQSTVQNMYFSLRK